MSQTFVVAKEVIFAVFSKATTFVLLVKVIGKAAAVVV